MYFSFTIIVIIKWQPHTNIYVHSDEWMNIHSLYFEKKMTCKGERAETIKITKSLLTL